MGTAPAFDVHENGDGTFSLTAHVPKLDRRTLRVEDKGSGHYVVHGTMWVRPGRVRWFTQEVVFDLQGPETMSGEPSVHYEDPTLTIHVGPRVS